MADRSDELLSGTQPGIDRSDELMSAYEKGIAAQTGPGYKPAPPEVQSGQEGSDFYKNAAKGLAGAAIVGGGAAAGGLPLAAYGTAAELGGGTAGTFLAELLRQKVFGEPTDVTEAGKAAALNLGLGSVTKLAAEAYGALGGIPPSFTRYVGRQNPIKAFSLTMREPAPTAELDLGRRIGSQVKSIGATITKPRQEFESLLASSTQSGKKISVQPVIDALESSKVQNATLPEVIQANVMLDARIKALQARETAGGMTAKELDSLINKELDPSAFRESGEVATTKLGPAYASARDAAKEQLLTGLPDRARVLREQVADELTWRELAKKYFGLQRPGKALVGTIKNLESPGSEEMKQALAEVSKQSGIDFNRMAMDLATKRAYTMDDRVKINIMNRIMMGLAAGAAASGRPGMGAAALLTAPVVAHTVSKVVAPLQTIAGPAGVSLYEYLRQMYGTRTAPEPTGKGKSGIIIQKPVSQSQARIRIGSGAGREF